MEEEDAHVELQALEAIYEEDLVIISSWPPHVRILLRPRTADDISQQFVEILLEIKATDKYPAVSPLVDFKQVKGLDETRQSKLLSLLQFQASSLLEWPMLVILAEAAVDFLTNNNYPEGECCFCLLPLMEQDHGITKETLSITKLVSCFHCFHSDCFATWWRWIFRDVDLSRYNTAKVVCPICRTGLHEKDIAHVRQQQHLVAASLLQEDTQIAAAPQIPKPLLEQEVQRQAHYVKTFQEQQARGGIIEKLEVILPGMMLPPRVDVVVGTNTSTSISAPDHDNNHDEQQQIAASSLQQGRTVKNKRRRERRHANAKVWIRKSPSEGI